MAELLHEGVWYDQRRCEAAEAALARQQCPSSPISATFALISADIEASLKAAPQSVQVAAPVSSGSSDVEKKLKRVEEENARLNNVVRELMDRINKLETHVFGATASKPPPQPPQPTDKDTGEDDDFDLFGSDEEDEDEDEVKAARIAAYEEKKAKKPTVVAKSNIILSVKPWDDETDMKEIERHVRSIEADGLVWGASKLVPLAYGIHTLQISCVVEDDKVGTDFLEENITAFEDLIQSMDVLAFNKV